MPKLKQIDCSIELGPNNTRLKEYGARYSDGHVESFIVVPEIDVPFSIHLKSEGYIAPGLAFFVFMDGEYQCNRNRIFLKLPGEGVEKHEYETEFRVRQKEEKTGFGTFVVRDWTFAKLNRVAADKAPNLNAQFLNNVGTIEVVILRCKTDVDEVPRAKAGRSEDKPAQEKAACVAKRSEQPKESVKATSQRQSDMGIGGMLGLFDGANDRDPIIEEQVVSANGRVRPQPPPGFDWDSFTGTWVRTQHPSGEANENTVLYGRLSFGESRSGSGEDESEPNIDAMQLDGPSDHHGQAFYPWGDRGRDDMRGDMYLGLQGSDRSIYKQYLRGTGVPVSTPPRAADEKKFKPEKNGPTGAQEVPIGLYQNYVQNKHDAKLGDPIRFPQDRPVSAAAYQLNAASICEDLQRLRHIIQQYIEKNSHKNLSKLLQERTQIERLHALALEPSGLALYPLWLEEALLDVEVLKRFITAIEKQYPERSFSAVLKDISNLQLRALADPRLRKEYRDDNVEDCRYLHNMFTARAKDMERFLDLKTAFSRAPVDIIQMRLRFVHWQRDQADRALGELVNHGGRDARRAADHARPLKEEEHVVKGGDGTWTGDNGWQEMGANTWKPSQQDDRNKEVEWLHNKADQKDDKNDKNEDWSKKGKEKSQKGDWNNWAGGPKDKPPSDKTYEHNLSNSPRWKGNGWSSPQKNSTRSRSHHGDGGWQTDGNQQADNNVGGWVNSGGDNANDNWGATEGHNQAPDNGWTNTKKSTHSNRSASKAGSEASTNFIKPYWKDWSKPYNRRDSSFTATPERRRAEPREVYNYPASSIPDVPEKKVKNASHGIQVGKGADYSHKCRKPIYLDTMEQPYAVFSFKYRSKKALEKIFKLKIDEMDMKKLEEEVEKSRLQNMPKHKLVEELMYKRTPQKSESGNKDGSKAGSQKGDGWANQNNNRQTALDNNAWGASGGDQNWDGNGNNGGSQRSSSSHGGRSRVSEHKSQSRQSNKKATNGWDNSPGNNDGNNGNNGNFAGW